MYEQRTYIMPERISLDADIPMQAKGIIDPFSVALFVAIVAITVLVVCGIYYLSPEQPKPIYVTSDRTLTNDAIAPIDTRQCMVLVMGKDNEPDYIVGDC